MTSLNEFVLEKKENKLNASVVMLFLYSMVVSFALVLVITKNFETDAEIEVQEEKVVEVKAIMEEMADVISVPEVYEEENREHGSFTAYALSAVRVRSHRQQSKQRVRDLRSNGCSFAVAAPWLLRHNA